MSTRVLGSINIPIYKDVEKYVSDKMRIGIPLNETDIDVITDDVHATFNPSSDIAEIKKYISNKYNILLSKLTEVSYNNLNLNGIH